MPDLSLRSPSPRAIPDAFKTLPVFNGLGARGYIQLYSCRAVGKGLNIQTHKTNVFFDPVAARLCCRCVRLFFRLQPPC